MIFALERLAGIASSRFHLGFYSDICFQALNWYSEFEFSPWIHNDICFQAPSWYSSDGLGHKIVDKSSSADGLGHEIVSADGLGA